MFLAKQSGVRPEGGGSTITCSPPKPLLDKRTSGGSVSQICDRTMESGPAAHLDSDPTNNRMKVAAVFLELTAPFRRCNVTPNERHGRINVTGEKNRDAQGIAEV
jgi:hypothetical protein